MEVAVAVFRILHILKGMLIAQSEPRIVLLLRQLVLSISGHDALQVAVAHTVIGIVYVLTVNDIIEAAVAFVASADELGARLQRLSLSEVQCQVGLPCMAGAPSLRVGVEVA